MPSEIEEDVLACADFRQTRFMNVAIIQNTPVMLNKQDSSQSEIYDNATAPFIRWQTEVSINIYSPEVLSGEFKCVGGYSRLLVNFLLVVDLWTCPLSMRG